MFYLSCKQNLTSESETGTDRSDRIPLKEKGHTFSIDLWMLFFLAALHLCFQPLQLQILKKFVEADYKIYFITCCVWDRTGEID